MLLAVILCKTVLTFESFYNSTIKYNKVEVFLLTAVFKITLAARA
jgi:hypothetical protein